MFALEVIEVFYEKFRCLAVDDGLCSLIWTELQRDLAFVVNLFGPQFYCVNIG